MDALSKSLPTRQGRMTPAAPLRAALEFLTLIGVGLAVALAFAQALDRQMELEAKQSTRAGQIARAYQ